jgi:hypothetical protein
MKPVLTNTNEKYDYKLCIESYENVSASVNKNKK